MSKYNKIHQIVRIRQMLRAWRVKASHRRSPPAGHVVVCVGINSRRFILRASHLNHPIFRQLLNLVEEEFGFANCSGPLTIPCDESLFEEILRIVTHGDSVNSDLQGCLPVGSSMNEPDCSCESGPLLYAFAA